MAISSSDMQSLGEQLLRLAEPQRVEILSLLLDSLRPPGSHAGAKELAETVVARAEAYHRGQLEAIELDESVRIARQAIASRQTSP